MGGKFTSFPPKKKRHFPPQACAEPKSCVILPIWGETGEKCVVPPTFGGDKEPNFPSKRRFFWRFGSLRGDNNYYPPQDRVSGGDIEFPPKLGGELNVPPTHSILGGIIIIISPQTPKPPKKSAFGGEIWLLVPPKRGGDNTFFTSFPPNWQDDARFWLRASLGGEMSLFLGGERSEFPPQ